MDYNPPSTADYAYANTQHNILSLQDAMVLIGWLSQRVHWLEAASGTVPPPLPPMPSTFNGFACVPKREQLVRDARHSIFGGNG